MVLRTASAASAAFFLTLHRLQLESLPSGAPDIDYFHRDFLRSPIMQGSNFNRSPDTSFVDRFNKIKKSPNSLAICFDNDVTYCAS